MKGRAEAAALGTSSEARPCGGAGGDERVAEFHDMPSFSLLGRPSVMPVIPWAPIKRIL